MEKAIEKAVEGGYILPEPFGIVADNQDEATKILNRVRAVILLDPIFWQALGKAIGGFPQCACDPYEGTKCSDFGLDSHKGREWWYRTWHRFIDHLIAGRDVDSFFTELLSDKK